MFGQFLEVKGIAPIFKDHPTGFFVDVGAHNGVTDSNTLYFEKLGWKGICVEPHKSFFPSLVKNRPRSVCLDVAVWDEELEAIPFYATAPGGWSRPAHPGKFSPIASYPVRTKPLDQILEEEGAPSHFELLSIDVEGTEWKVLKGFSLGKWLPRVIVIEDLSLAGDFDEYFAEEGYLPVYSWAQHRGGSNVIYTRFPEDLATVKENWRA